MHKCVDVFDPLAKWHVFWCYLTELLILSWQEYLCAEKYANVQNFHPTRIKSMETKRKPSALLLFCVSKRRTLEAAEKRCCFCANSTLHKKMSKRKITVLPPFTHGLVGEFRTETYNNGMFKYIYIYKPGEMVTRVLQYSYNLAETFLLQTQSAWLGNTSGNDRTSLWRKGSLLKVIA